MDLQHTFFPCFLPKRVPLAAGFSITESYTERKYSSCKDNGKNADTTVNGTACTRGGYLNRIDYVGGRQEHTALLPCEVVPLRDHRGQPTARTPSASPTTAIAA
ncbi:hypothetical protein [Streptomyces sp. Go-475]|uniref:hypothetical protein n=1 Tax=Streptomyces sp. Go-475 TaxID=2072505 RepID=UPI000DF02840|nr:hypothetical protein [Streptomyces sp. Go-475]AXE88330.1 hypothetical protein C1703_25305 [Streptomyces sp. Go-475]